MNSPGSRLIIALDVESMDRALSLVDTLSPFADMFKIGSQLFTNSGPIAVARVRALNARVFLDLKFHDIPNTVAKAATEAVRMGVTMFNVHASGGSEMMKRAADAVLSESTRLGVKPPIVIAVTVLTSATEKELVETGVDDSINDQVLRLSRLAKSSGMDGIVASPREIRLVRKAVGDSQFVIVTPGVRPSGGDHNDQKRVMTPGEAIAEGASFLVVGRSITSASDPALAASSVVLEMNHARDQSQSGALSAPKGVSP